MFDSIEEFIIVLVLVTQPPVFDPIPEPWKRS